MSSDDSKGWLSVCYNYLIINFIASNQLNIRQIHRLHVGLQKVRKHRVPDVIGQTSHVRTEKIAVDNKCCCWLRQWFESEQPWWQRERLVALAQFIFEWLETEL